MECLLFDHPTTPIWTENGEQDVAFARTQLANQGLCEVRNGERMAVKRRKKEKTLGLKPALQIVNKN